MARSSLQIDTVIHADCLEAMRGLPSNSVDAIVTDPPAGIAFMGKDWDNPDMFPLRDRSLELHGARKTGGGNPTNANGFARGVNWQVTPPARHAFIAFMTEVMAECLRVVKPGGHALVWALPRTSHWTATALEDAGWSIRDTISAVFRLRISEKPRRIQVCH